MVQSHNKYKEVASLSRQYVPGHYGVAFFFSSISEALLRLRDDSAVLPAVPLA